MINNEIASKLVTLTNALPGPCVQLAYLVVHDLPDAVRGGLLITLGRRAPVELPLSRADDALITVLALRGDLSPDAQIELIKAFAILAECEREADARIVLQWLARIEALIRDTPAKIH